MRTKLLKRSVSICCRKLELVGPGSTIHQIELFHHVGQKLAEILSLFKLYNNLGKVAVRVKLWLIIYCGHLVEWIVK